MQSPIILALDVEDIKEALSYVDELFEYIDIFKVGPVLFIKYGRKIVDEIKSRGKNVFLDLKLHDIPNTVRLALESIIELRVDFVTLHLSGGRNMIREAVKVAKDTETKLLGVTVLTSITDDDLTEMGIRSSVPHLVRNLAKIGIEENIDGIVCSPMEIKIVRELSENTIIVTPGIRMREDSLQDQKRVMTPQEAINQGANFIVMGRSLLEEKDRIGKIKRILEGVRFT